MDRTLSLLIKFAALDRLTGPMRKIGGASAKATRELAATRGELKELERTQVRIGKLRDLERNLLGTGAQADKQRVRIAALKAELRSAGVDVSALARHEDRLGREIAATTSRLDEQKAALARSASMSARLQQAQSFGGSVAGFGLGAAFAGAAIGAPLVEATASASELRSSMTDIALKANLTEVATARIGRELALLGPRVAQLPEALIAGVDALAGFGLDPALAARMMEPIGRTATAYKATIADLSAASFSVHDNLKVPIEQTARALDVMAVAGKAGAFEMKDMAQYFPALTAAAQGLGQTGVGAVADLGAALQITRKGAGDSATAANNLLNLLNKINTKDTVKNFKDFGVDLPAAMRKAAKEGKSPIEAIAELTKKTLKGDLGKLAFLFGDAQVQAALRPLIQNTGEYKRIRASAGGAGADGTVDRDYARRDASGELAPARARANFQALKDVLGTALLPIANRLLETLNALLVRLSLWVEKNPELASNVMMAVAALAGLLFVVGSIGVVLGPFVIGIVRVIGAVRFLWPWLIRIGPAVRIMGGLLGRLGPILRLVGSGIFAFAQGIARAGMLLLTNPVVLLAAAIGVAAYLIYTHWDTIKAAFWSAVTWLQGLWARFKALGANLIQGLIDGLMGKLGALKAAVVGIATSARDWFKARLGIQSPSRVFAQLGGFVTQGLAQGIERGGRTPVDRITTIAGRMAAALALGAAPPALAGVGGGGAGASAGAPRYEIHVYAAPGMDEQELARLVVAELDKRDRAAAAAGRSSYQDDA